MSMHRFERIEHSSIDHHITRGILKDGEVRSPTGQLLDWAQMRVRRWHPKEHQFLAGYRPGAVGPGPVRQAAQVCHGQVSAGLARVEQYRQ
jgi:hypothetical protein